MVKIRKKLIVVIVLAISLSCFDNFGNIVHAEIQENIVLSDKPSDLRKLSPKSAYLNYYQELSVRNLKLLDNDKISDKGLIIDAYNAAQNMLIKVQNTQDSLFSGIVYDTPIYKQDMPGMSYYYSKIMISDTIFDVISFDIKSQDLKTNTVKQRVNDLILTDSVGDKSVLLNIPSFMALKRHLVKSGPLYAAYKIQRGDVVKSKTVVVRGVIECYGFPSIVITNSPEGHINYQLFNEFISYPAGETGLIDKSEFDIELDGIYDPRLFCGKG